MRLSALNTEVTTSVSFASETAEMRIRPSVITAAFEDRLRGTDRAMEVASLLAEIVTFVDITDDAGQPIPCTPESFAALPIQLLMEMFKVAGEAARPNPQTGVTSAAG